jgi:hypothetical protein
MDAARVRERAGICGVYSRSIGRPEMVVKALAASVVAVFIRQV